MKPRDIETAAQAKALVESSNQSHVKVGVFDIDGVLRGKYMSKAKFLEALDHDFGFCDVVLGWDMADKLYDNAEFTGWHTGYPDTQVRILPSSCRTMPMEDDDLFFLGEFAGNAEAICPRGVLRNVLKQAKEMGLNIFTGFEYEFFVFQETPESIREKNYQNLTPLTPGDYGYSVIRNTTEKDTYKSLLSMCEQMDIPIEGLHEETGPGVMEAAIAYSDALDSADKASLFKTFTKISMQKEGKIATFMARWNETLPGQSGHIHLSIKNDAGDSVFYDPSQANNMSEVMQQFVAGQQKLMPELISMIAPTVNSYKRLIPGFWAPTVATVGIDNRTCAIRIIPGSENSQRLEYRIGAADANPYIILSAVIASGLWGIKNKAKLENLVTGNAYEQTFPAELQLSRSLGDAAKKLSASVMAREYFGDAFVNHFSGSRDWEQREYDKHISSWEMSRYFELI